MVKKGEFLLRILCIILFTSCGGGGGGGGNGNSSGGPGSNLNLPPGDGVLKFSPFDVSLITDLEPLGTINPPGGHTTPTDHVYFYYAVPPSVPPVVQVYAPGDGIIVQILTNTTPPYDSKTWVRMTGTFLYYLDHVVNDPWVTVGAKVTAGQHFGVNGQPWAIDLGVENEAITLTGYANPLRYGYENLHAVSPFKYYQAPLQTQLYSMVNRVGNDKDGKIDYDVPGTLSVAGIATLFHLTLRTAPRSGLMNFASCRTPTRRQL